MPAERKCADPGACKVVASSQLDAEVAAIDPNAVGSDDLPHYDGGVELGVLLCRYCDSGPIAPLAGSAILS